MTTKEFVTNLKNTILNKDNEGYVNRHIPDETYYKDGVMVGYGNADEPFITGYTYVFFTKPRLNLFPQPVVVTENQTMKDKLFEVATSFLGIDETIGKNSNSEYKATMTSSHNINLENPVYKYLFDSGRYSHIQSLLCDVADGGSENLFIPILTNRVTNVDISDDTISNSDSTTTWQGYTLTLPNKTIDSNTNGTVSFEFIDNMNLDLTILFKAWVTYADGLREGSIMPSINSIINSELDFLDSIYIICTKPDGRTITYYCKYTGCMPTNVPTSSLSGSKNSHDVNRINVQFSYFHKDELCDWIIDEFNELSGFNDRPFAPTTRDDSSYNGTINYVINNNIFTPSTRVGILKDATSSSNGYISLHKLIFS